MTDPFYSGPQQPKVERRLTELPLTQRPEHVRPPNQLTPKDVTDLFDGFAFAINRATALIQAVEPRASKLFIPVDPDATAVRAALRRKLPGSNGDQIPFSLYKDMLDFRVKTARKIKLEIASELTGDVVADAAKIKKHLRTGGKGLSSWDEFILTMEQFALWFLLNQLQGTFSSVEHQEVCVAKSPPGTETGPVMLRQAIAMAAMMLILGMREDHVMFAVRAPADAMNIPPVDIINRARRLTQSDLHREVTEIVGASDHQLIIDYADNYIIRHATDYEDWIAYRDLRHIREYTVVTYVHSHQYSTEYSTLLDYSFEGVHTVPVGSNGNPFINGALGIQRRGTTVQYTDGILDIPPEHYVALANQLAMIDRNISGIAGVLTNGFTLDLLCCVGRFLGKHDIEFLKRLRTIMQAAYNFLATKSIQVNSPANVMDFVVAAIQQSMIAFAQRYFQKIAKDVLKWASKTDDKTWESLFVCPLIEDLVIQALNAIAQFQAEIYRMIEQFIGQSFGFNDGVYTRWGHMYDAKRVKTIIAIIDGLIASIEACANLENGGIPETEPQNPGENPAVYAGIPQPLVLDSTIQAKFFSNPNPIARKENERPIPAVGRIEAPGDVTSTRNFREICRGIIPDEFIASILRSQESA